MRTPITVLRGMLYAGKARHIDKILLWVSRKGGASNPICILFGEGLVMITDKYVMANRSIIFDADDGKLLCPMTGFFEYLSFKGFGFYEENQRDSLALYTKLRADLPEFTKNFWRFIKDLPVYARYKVYTLRLSNYDIIHSGGYLINSDSERSIISNGRVAELLWEEYRKYGNHSAIFFRRPAFVDVLIGPFRAL